MKHEARQDFACQVPRGTNLVGEIPQPLDCRVPDDSELAPGSTKRWWALAMEVCGI
jgi:hypothetical protein